MTSVGGLLVFAGMVGYVNMQNSCDAFEQAKPCALTTACSCYFVDLHHSYFHVRNLDPYLSCQDANSTNKEEINKQASILARSFP